MAASSAARGWAAVFGLAVLTMAFSVVNPAPLIFLPLATLLIALPQRRPVALALAAAIALLFFTGAPTGSLWYLERGWPLVLSAWFVVCVVVWPDERFLPRALFALVASFASAGMLLGLRAGGFTRVDALIGERLHNAADQALESWGSVPLLRRVGGDFAGTLERTAEYQALLFPALLALASLAGLAVAWWAYRRLSVRELKPLASLREFRFHDGFVWLLIAGVLLLLLPLDDLAVRAGSNLLAFMAALYTLRGLAVLIVVSGTPGPLTMALGAVLVVLLYPLVLATTFIVGLTDTWLDLRTRRTTPPAAES